MLISTAHASLQRTDDQSQKAHDARKIFERARHAGHLWVTGTEAGTAGMKRELRRKAEAHGYSFTSRSDVWISIRKQIWRDEAQWRPVIPGQTGHWMPRGILSVDVAVPRIGELTIGVVHYVPGGVKNDDLNRQIAEQIGHWSNHKSRGDRKVFLSGDMNRDDKTQDVFYGLTSMTTAWDELRKHEPTGGKGGTLDVIASHDKDGRVEARKIEALSDSEFFLNTDHRLVEAVFRVQEI